MLQVSEQTGYGVFLVGQKYRSDTESSDEALVGGPHRHTAASFFVHFRISPPRALPRTVYSLAHARACTHRLVIMFTPL